MSNRRHYLNDRRPRARGMLPREHYVRKHGSWKPKMSFENEASADNWIESRSFFREGGYVSYLCSVCNCWHVGLPADKRQDKR